MTIGQNSICQMPICKKRQTRYNFVDFGEEGTLVYVEGDIVNGPMVVWEIDVWQVVTAPI
jgi:hypothetical protein